MHDLIYTKLKLIIKFIKLYNVILTSIRKTIIQNFIIYLLRDKESIKKSNYFINNLKSMPVNNKR